MTLNFTEGAQRVLKTATRLASGQQASDVQAEHLLEALLLEEGRASDVLLNNGFVRDTKAADRGACSGCHTPDGPPAPAPSRQLDSLLQDARHLSGPLRRDTEIGTEHLLWSLTRLQSPVAARLLDQGIDERLLEELFGDARAEAGEPIDVALTIADILPAHATEETAEQSGKPERADTAGVWRILDAASNRAREGLRVLEDYTRFCLDDRGLTEEIKRCRHQISHTVNALDSGRLLSSRDTTHDIGTTLSTPTETIRTSIRDVLNANLKRVQESVRTLEEYSKLIHQQSATVFEQARYQMYVLEQRLLESQPGPHALDDRRLYLLLSEAACRIDWSLVATQALEAGVRMIQLREKTKPDRELVQIGRRLREMTAEHEALLIVNDRADVAAAIGADGVHVGQDELSVTDARRILGPGRLVGVSTHSLKQAQTAVDQGADYVGVGPVFPSQTKQFTDFVGLDLVPAVAEHIAIPWYAIGGISATNLSAVRAAGAPGAAVTAAICGAPDVSGATRELLGLLGQE